MATTYRPKSFVEVRQAVRSADRVSYGPWEPLPPQALEIGAVYYAQGIVGENDILSTLAFDLGLQLDQIQVVTRYEII
jgi:hypothetical protein